MRKEEKTAKLLARYKLLVDKLNQLNEAMNEVGTNSEDMIPGHDEGAEWYAKWERYKITMDQIREVKEELRKLGYRKAL